MTKQLEGKMAIITGADSGMGQAMAETCWQQIDLSGSVANELSTFTGARRGDRRWLIKSGKPSSS